MERIFSKPSLPKLASISSTYAQPLKENGELWQSKICIHLFHIHYKIYYYMPSYTSSMARAEVVHHRDHLWRFLYLGRSSAVCGSSQNTRANRCNVNTCESQAAAGNGHKNIRHLVFPSASCRVQDYSIEVYQQQSVCSME